MFRYADMKDFWKEEDEASIFSGKESLGNLF